MTATKLTKRPRRTDPQRNRVYYAEYAHSAYKMRTIDPTLLAYQQFVDDLLSQRFVRRRLAALVGRPHPHVLVRFCRRDADFSICENGNSIAVAFNNIGMPLPLLHILALAITYHDLHRSHHDYLFCQVYLLLIRRTLGKEAEDEMKALFKARRVRFHKSRKRKPGTPLTPVQTIELVERLRRGKMAAEMARAFDQPAEQFKPLFKP